MTTLLSILIVASSIAMIGVAIMSDPAESGMGALTGQSAQGSFFGNSGGDRKEAVLNKINIVAAIVFAISLLLIARF